MISQTAEYALRAVVHLAGQSGPCTNQQIAQATKVPPGYLAKVMQALGRAELVSAQRGLHGGFVLSRAAAAITVLDIISAVDPLQRIHKCPLDLPEHANELCPLHRRLDEAMLSVERELGATSLSSLIPGQAPSCLARAEKKAEAPARRAGEATARRSASGGRTRAPAARSPGEARKRG